MKGTTMKTKFSWLKRIKRSQPEPPLEPPIWFGPHSNCEYFKPQTERDRKLRKLVLETADRNARRVGLDRREFLASTMGMATTLACINAVSGCGTDSGGSTSGQDGGAGGGNGGSGGSGGGSGGGLCVPPEAMFDEQVACEVLGGDEFIFDVQTHWFKQSDTARFPDSVQMIFGALFATTTEERYVTDMFLESQTHMAVLTSWPGTTCTDDLTLPCGLPLSNESMAQSRDDINRMGCNTQRVVQHVQILPNDPSGVERQKEIMAQMYCENLAYGWKMYPGFDAQSSIDPRAAPGYFLDEAPARELIEHGLSLGLNRFCVHKGLQIGNFFDVEHNQPREIGIVAKDYPDANFIIYHSAINAGSAAAVVEGAYDPADPNPLGVNQLIRALEEAGVGPNANVYGEVGSAINQLQTDPTAAAHFFGKLMKHIGVDRVGWGTDCVLYGSPQPFIEWFRALTIPESMQTDHGYPALDATAKRKILGENAARLYGIDIAAQRCQIDSCQQAWLRKGMDEELGIRRWMFRAPGGPKTYADFLEDYKRQLAVGRPG
jgi:predicted TIM-barrel fold metal-dependent hydrolase